MISEFDANQARPPGATGMVAGLPFIAARSSDVVTWLSRWGMSDRESRSGLSVRLSNAWCVALAQTDPDYRKVLLSPGINLPDGTPVAAVLRAQNRRAQRTRGPDFFRHVLEASRGNGSRHFFLGAKDATLALLMREVEERYPGLRVVGSYAPPYAPVDENFVEECRLRLRAADPDYVWLGLGTPKQDILSVALAPEIPAAIIGVGAAFDFIAGTVREAPKVFRRLGIEWLFRLAVEPKRLWRRYVIGNAIFARAVVCGGKR